MKWPKKEEEEKCYAANLIKKDIPFLINVASDLKKVKKKISLTNVVQQTLFLKKINKIQE